MTTITKKHRLKTILPLAAVAMFASASVSNADVVQFTADDTWIVPDGVTSIDYLVVGGGGGGGGQGGGGGGGGEFLADTLLVTPGETFTITIGLGGATNGNNTGTTGDASSFISTSSSVTANGGGGGGAILNVGVGLGGAGTGSAGGNGWVDGQPQQPAVAGGNGGSGGRYGGSDLDGGGGGGAGGDGLDGIDDVGGDGGIGLQSSITGNYYAGGGGGAAFSVGGLGGGGKGGIGHDEPTENDATPGLANTGGGGGGADDGPAIGGSGIVIVSFEAGSTSSPPAITSFTSLGGDDWQLTLKGKNSTAYEFYSSTTLDFTSGTLVENLVQIEGEGLVDGTNNSVLTTTATGNATVQMELTGSPADFVRAEEKAP